MSDMSGDKIITIFDAPYPAEKQAEGIAVNWAVLSGACNTCPYLSRCESDESFFPHSNAACMVRKDEILHGAKGEADE